MWASLVLLNWVNLWTRLLLAFNEPGEWRCAWLRSCSVSVSMYPSFLSGLLFICCCKKWRNSIPFKMQFLRFYFLLFDINSNFMYAHTHIYLRPRSLASPIMISFELHRERMVVSKTRVSTSLLRSWWVSQTQVQIMISCIVRGLWYIYNKIIKSKFSPWSCKLYSIFVRVAYQLIWVHLGIWLDRNW